MKLDKKRASATHRQLIIGSLISAEPMNVELCCTRARLLQHWYASGSRDASNVAHLAMMSLLSQGKINKT